MCAAKFSATTTRRTGLCRSRSALQHAPAATVDGMASLSVREAAERARTSDRTVRRWIAEGKLPATKTADGWTVDESDLAEHLDGRTSVDGQADGRTHGRPSAEAPLLAELVRDLTRQNIELAGLVGSLQQRLSFADERIRALEAPKETTSPESPQIEPSDASPVEVTQRPATQPRRAPWWMPWRRATS
jgi:excisionase family DNA binding protein